MQRRDFGLMMLTAPLLAQAPAKFRVYVGTYTRGASKGIYQYEMDAASGTLTPLGVAVETANPSFLALHPKGNFLYSVGELEEFQGQKVGSVNAYAVDQANGKLTLLNQVGSGGSGPCHVKVSDSGRVVLCANYGGGSASAYALGADGKIGKRTAFFQHAAPFGPNAARQSGPHAHSINLDNTNRFAVVADLGKDRVIVYKFNGKSGAMAPHSEFAVAPGSGPRHFAFHPNGKWAYVINEMLCTLTAMNWDAKAGKLTEINTEPTMPIPVGRGLSTAETVVHPNGRFVYGSNRGHDSIAIFSIDAAAGRIRRIGNEPTQGKTPRNFNIDPTGRFLVAANQDSDSLMVFRIDGGTGKLTPVGRPVPAPVPVCVKFLAMA
jgi:6-phosphogluconolactonase